MKKKDVIKLYNALNSINGLKGVKFNYAVAKNKRILENERGAMEKALEQSDEFKKYESERVELCIKYAEKDKKGNPVMVNNNYKIEEKKEKTFEKEFEKLQKEHKSSIKEREKQFEEYNKLLEEKVEIKLHKIKEEDIPEDITTNQLDSIFDILEDK